MELDKAFHFRDGRAAHTITDLKDIIQNISEDDFSHHCNEFKNDFADWIEHVLNYAELASRVRECPLRQDLLLALNEEVIRSEVSGSLEDLKKQAAEPQPMKDGAETNQEGQQKEPAAEEPAEKSDEQEDPIVISTDKPKQPNSSEDHPSEQLPAKKSSELGIQEPVKPELHAPGPQAQKEKPVIDKKHNPKYFSLKEFLLGLLLALCLGIIGTIVVIKLLNLQI